MAFCGIKNKPSPKTLGMTAITEVTKVVLDDEGEKDIIEVVSEFFEEEK